MFLLKCSAIEGSDVNGPLGLDPESQRDPSHEFYVLLDGTAEIRTEERRAANLGRDEYWR